MAKTIRKPVGPKRKVTEAHLRGAGSVFAPFKFHYWLLDLDCGHTVERRIRWLPPEPGAYVRRGWAAQHRGPSLTRLPPDPVTAHCEVCAGREISSGSAIL